MSIRIRNKRFVVDYYPEGRKGQRIRLSLPESVTNIEDARAIEKGFRTAKDSPGSEVPSNAIINDSFPQYLSWYELHRAKRTFEDVSSVYKNHISPILGKERIENITLNHINVYKRIRKTDKTSLTNRTINKELNYFSGFLKWCERYAGMKPKAFRIEKLPYTRPIPMVLTFDEAQRLIQAADTPYKVFFLALFSLGLRFNEASKLKWQDVDLANRTLKITGKGGRTNILPISDWLYQELKDLKKISASVWVFPSKKKDQPISDIRQAIKRAKAKAGIDKHIYPHLLRHSLATYLLEKNVNLRTIQEILGHRQVSTTEFYTQVAMESKRKALMVIERSRNATDFKKGFPAGDHKKVKKIKGKR